MTLPGIAGLILSIGMGVDCNVITAERIKEELKAGRTLDGALERGTKNSLSAIVDGNMTVIIVSIILMLVFILQISSQSSSVSLQQVLSTHLVTRFLSA